MQYPLGKLKKSVLQVQKEFEFGISKEVRVDFAAETDDEQEEKEILLVFMM